MMEKFRKNSFTDIYNYCVYLGASCELVHLRAKPTGYSSSPQSFEKAPGTVPNLLGTGVGDN